MIVNRREMVGLMTGAVTTLPLATIAQQEGHAQHHEIVQVLAD
jgi:hypothetical protein